MTCEACREALSSESGRVNRINECSEQICGCEAYSVSDHSPGCVDDDETLHYLVPTPEGRTENGFLSPTFLISVDTDGLSVLRHRAQDNEFEVTVAELRPRWQDKSRSLEGIMSFKASAVRYLDGHRLCCVYDTGMPEKPNHADLMAPSLEKLFPGSSKTEIKKRQRARIKQIIDQIGNNFTQAAAFRDGRLAHLVK